MSKKVLLVSSHGGHWVQLRKMSSAFNGMDVHYMTTTNGVRNEIYPASLYIIPDAHLDEKLRLIYLSLKIFFIMIRVRPDIVMSTGAAPGYFALFFGKLFGAKTIWVDSVANVEKLSVSGQKIKRYADLWLTQWKHLARPEGPFYKGSVL